LPGEKSAKIVSDPSFQQKKSFNYVLKRPKHENLGSECLEPSKPTWMGNLQTRRRKKNEEKKFLFGLNLKININHLPIQAKIALRTLRCFGPLSFSATFYLALRLNVVGLFFIGSCLFQFVGSDPV
jgi:hypothetical protein